MKQLILFVVFNSILPFTDVGSDAYTFYDLYQNEHPLWAFLTFYLMWNPFVLHLLSFVFHVIQAWWKEDDEYDWWGALVRYSAPPPFADARGHAWLRPSWPACTRWNVLRVFGRQKPLRL